MKLTIFTSLLIAGFFIIMRGLDMKKIFSKIISLTVLFVFLAGSTPAVLAQEDNGTSTLPTATSTPAADTTAVVVPRTYAGSDVPQILPRSTWDNSPDLHALLTWMPQNETFPSDWQPVERIVIHHSATPNNDTISAIQRIQSIYRFHSATKGWGDIGYNYIIGQDGKIYEGRYGGNGSRGAHVFRDSDRYNFNFGTVGIVLLGTYSSQDASPQMYDSTERLVAWLTALDNLDPAATKTSSIWDQNTNNFTGTFTGLTALGHKNIESTDCPGIINLEKIRQGSLAFWQNYQTYAYQVAGSDSVYKVEKGVKKTFNSLAELNAASGNKYTKVVLVNKEQVNLFSDNRFYKFATGSLIKTGASSKVYLVENGKVRPFETSAAQFNKLGFDFAKVKIVSQDEMDSYALGLAVKYAPDNTLVKDTGDGKIYSSENGKKRYIGTASLFNFLGFVWSAVKSFVSSEINSYLIGEPMKYPDGSLVKSDKNPVVYLINNGQLYQILSAGIFSSLKLSWKNIKPLPSAEIDAFSKAGPAKHGEGTLIKAESSPNIYVIRNGEKQIIRSAAEFLQAGYAWANILTLAINDFTALYGSLEAASIAAADNQTNSGGPNTSSGSSGPTARIMIYEVPASQDIIISASGPYKQCDANNNCQAKNGQTSVAYSTSVFAKFVPDSSAIIMEIVSYSDLNWNKTANYNKFRGNIEIKYSAKSQKLFAINELALEDYLKGIAEVSNSDEYGHLQTLIVASRTYAYNYIIKGGKYGADEVYHLKNTPADQLYKGYGREGLAPNVVRAASETMGEIATYNGSPIVAAYSSGADEIRTSGTRSACSVWGGRYCQVGYEYLFGGVKDPDNAPYTQTACGGGNHCVGLSAAGSRQMAKLGKSYKEILAHYYIGTTISKAY